MGRGPRKLACVSILRQQRNIHVWFALHYRSYSSGPELCIVRFMDFRPVTCFWSAENREKKCKIRPQPIREAPQGIPEIAKLYI